MSKALFRRFSSSSPSRNGPPLLTGDGETVTKAAKMLLKSLEAYMEIKSPEKLEEIGARVGTVWSSLFDIENVAAPQKKYELAEELLFRPDIMRLLLIAFRLVHIDVKRKIRDLYMFITTWCSNDAPDSSVPRTRSKTKFTPKVRDLLFHCRYEIVDIVDEGYDMPASIGFYNDIIREFVTDDFCLTSLFEDNGQDSNNIQHRNDGCIWSIFDRLMNTNKFRDFDVIQGTFDTLQIIFFTNHESANNFIKNNLPRFMQTLHKLIACSNFFIQAKSFKFLNELFTAQTNYETRSLWMAEPAFIKLVVLAIQSNKHAVRSRAVSILEIFIRNPRNSPEVHEFIGRNRNVLIAFFFNSAPIHYYQGSPNEKEDAQYARMAYKLLNWDMQRPFTQEQLQDFEEGWTHQKKMREEQLVRTCFHDNNPRLPKVNHVYRTRIIPNQQFLREPLKFGNPFRQ